MIIMRRMTGIALAALLLLGCGKESRSEVRKSALAGTWYPAGAGELSRTVEGFLKGARAETSLRDPWIFFLPHAGYAYSGEVLASAYSLMRGRDPDLIVIIAPSHYGSFSGCSLPSADWYETPLGLVRVDLSAAAELLKTPYFRNHRRAHEKEHAIEIHLPFLQTVFRGVREKETPILPVLAGQITPGEAPLISRHLMDVIRKKRRPLLIISTDFTHYGPRFGYRPFGGVSGKALREKIRVLDEGALKYILRGDPGGFDAYMRKTSATICGRNPILLALTLPLRDYRAERIAYRNSGDDTGDYENCVTYAAVAAVGGGVKDSSGALSPETRRYLLRLARSHLSSWVNRGRGEDSPGADIPPSCLEKRGVFVTLTKKGTLRGCIGYIEGIKPLCEGVRDNAYNAAFRDPRFEPLKKGELKEVRIEISVLTVPMPVRDIRDIRVGRDGLIVEHNGRRGLLLPQVPVEWGWNREEFLRQTCRKAGLPDNAWMTGAKVYAFQAEVFGEGDG